MKLIDAKKKLTRQSIVDFIADQPLDTDVDVVSENTDILLSTTLGQLEEFFKKDEVSLAFTEDKDVISFMTLETTLQILGLDLKYYIAPVRGVPFKRLSKLFDSETQVEDMNNNSTTTQTKSRDKSAKSSKPIILVTCGTFNDMGQTDEETYEGTKNDVISFINKYHSMSLLRNRFSVEVKFKINNEENWHTFDELVDEGVFEI